MATGAHDPIIDWAVWDAVLFDLDGVLTATAALHAASWQRLFDDFLAARRAAPGEDCRPFAMPQDYARFIDGRPRADGVRRFLASRGIRLPHGTPADRPGQATVVGLGRRKHRLFTELLRTKGIDTYAGTLAVVQQVIRYGARTGVVSSSRSCAAILRAAGLADLFDVRIDGEDAAQLGLAGKPAPDTFLQAARKLDVEPERTAIVEDAVAGVEAGRAGGFGLIVAIDRTGAADELALAGADVVVTDLGDTLAIPDPAPGPPWPDGETEP